MMDVNEIVDVVRKLGYVEVMTAGGWVSLKDFDPYNGAIRNLKYHFDAQSEAIVEEIPAGEVFGVWKVRK